MVIAYHAKEFENAEPRAHPWSSAVLDDSQVYVDFKANPKLIRTSLEDFNPFKGEPFVERFFSLLEWLNGPSSLLESNDSAFRGLVENTTDKQFPYSRKCQGRLMILYRDIAENCQPKSIEWLMKSMGASVEAINPSFRAGAIGLSRVGAVYKVLGDRSGTGAKGEQVMLSFFAYGKNDRRSFESMEKVLECAHLALEKINRIKVGEVRAIYGDPAKP
jgi:hypothetical protein